MLGLGTFVSRIFLPGEVFEWSRSKGVSMALDVWRLT